MPVWITPLLWPLWWLAEEKDDQRENEGTSVHVYMIYSFFIYIPKTFSFSTTAIVFSGYRAVSSLAVANPTIPPPIISMS